MASTVLTDVNFQSEIFAMEMNMAFTHRLELLNSGAMQMIPDEIVSSNSTGYTVAIPRWVAPSASATQITSASSTTVNNITDIKDIAAWVERETAWGADQAIAYIAGKDPLRQLATMLGEYWANQVHASMISTLTGVFTTALASTHVYDASATGTGIISKSAVLKAKALQGDHAENLTLAIMNSAIHTDAVSEQLLTDGGYADEVSKTGRIDLLLGSRVFQSDKLTATAGVYPTYFAAPGAMAYKFRNRRPNSLNNANLSTINANGLIIEVELNRVPKTAGGQDEIITRASYLTHVPGVQFDGTVTSNPTNTELATGTTWTKVQTDNKLIPVVQLLTKSNT